jgi:methylase of polypeptide subunit release factors
MWVEPVSRAYKKTIYEALGRDPVHPFPARMAPGIVLDVLASESKPIRVLDPMMGSGTVLAVARAYGHFAQGVDIDPLAVLLTRVWTTAVDIRGVERKSADVLERARRDSRIRPMRDSYPINSDSETREFVRYWFDDHARRQLASLSRAINAVRDNRIRDALWCAFSRLIITKQAGASLAMDLSHSRPHKAFDRAPIKPFDKFIDAVRLVLKNCIKHNQLDRGPATKISLGDARCLPIGSGTIDLVLTSPPYLNAIDYMRCSKFSLVWMGYNVRELSGIRTDSVGTECGDQQACENESVRKVIAALNLSSTLSARHEAVLAHYIEDMKNSIDEVARVLAPTGKAIYVVGENTVRGTFIPNAKIVSAIAELAGLKVDTRRERLLPANRRYLPPPKKRNAPEALDGRMRREVILSLSKCDSAI